MDEIDKILKHYGWQVICESPFEISHNDGSFASGQAARYLIDSLNEEYEIEVNMMPINLVFDEINHFDPTAEKYGDKGNHVEWAKTVYWFINNAETSIEVNYTEGAPRRVEMNLLCDSLRKQLRGQLTKEQCEEIKI